MPTTIRSILDEDVIRSVDEEQQGDLLHQNRLSPISQALLAGDFNPLELTINAQKQQEAAKANAQQIAQARDAAFHQWFGALSEANKMPKDSSPDDPSHFYDYRGYFDAMLAKAVPPPKLSPVDGKYHLSDIFKLPGNPTYFTKQNPVGWTIKQTQDYIKMNPPQNPVEEAHYNVLLQDKKNQVETLKKGLMGDTQLRATPEPNVFQKMKNKLNDVMGDIGFVESPEFRRAKAANVMAIAKNFNLDPNEVDKHYESYAMNQKYTGFKPDATPEDVVNAIMTPAVVVGLVTQPEITIPALIGFGILDKIVPTAKLLESTNLTPEAKSGIRLLDMGIKGAIAGGGAKLLKENAPAILAEIKNRNQYVRTPEQIFKDKSGQILPDQPKPPEIAVEGPIGEVQGKKIVSDELQKNNDRRGLTPQTLSPDEKVAQDFVTENFPQAMKNYVERSKTEFDGADNVVSADLGKFAVPGMNAAKSGAYHEAGSALAKVREAELLADPKTLDKPAEFMAGGSGSGKTHIVRENSGDLKEQFAIVYDTNLNNLESAKSKINNVLQTGRNIDITYVYRDPIKAWDGVITRTRTQHRIVPIAEHIKTHQGSLPTVEKLYGEYKDDPRFRFYLVNNSQGKGEHVSLDALDKVPKFDYTRIEERLYDLTKEAYEKQRITKPQFNTALEGSPKLQERAVSEGLLNDGSLQQERGPQESPGSTPSGVAPLPTTVTDVLNKIVKPGEDLQGKVPLSEGSGGDKTRKFITTVKEAEKTAPEVAQGVESRYSVLPNKETLAQAKDVIAKDYNAAVDMVNGPEKPTALHNAVGILLVDKAQAEGRFADAINLVDRIAEKQTELGQAIQALSMYERLTPEGILFYAKKQIRKAREGIKQKERVTNFDRLAEKLDGPGREALAKKLGVPDLSERKATELRGMAEEIQKMPEGWEKAIATAKMMKEVADLIPPTLGQKVSMLQTMAQLLNPKTFIRNLLGNVGFLLTEGISDVAATALDVAAALRTGKRSVYLPDLKVQGKGAAQGLKEGIEESLIGVDLKQAGSSKFTLPKNGVFNKGVLGALEKTMRISLGATDRAFYQAAFNQSLRDQTRAAGVAEPTEAMIEQAHMLGLYRTFQDDNVLSRQFIALKKWLNMGKTFGIGDIVLKYPKTPANILARGIEYSPFGFMKAVYKLAKPLAGEPFDQEGFVRSTSRALVGSALLVGTGAMLGELGIISGKRSKDKDVSATRENVGIKEYQVNVSALKRFAASGMDPEQAKMQEGDTLVSYDWMLPSSIGLALGANMVLDPKTNLVDRALNMGDRMLQASETLQEQPLVRGVKVLTSKQNLAEGISDTFQDIPASFVPTLLNQIRQLTDNTARSTKDPNYFKEIYNKAIMRIPGAANTLPARVTPLGQDKEIYQFGTNNPFNVFLNPAFVTKYAPDPVSKMVLDIWETSGQTIQFPRVAAAKIKLGSDTPEPMELTPAQYTSYQKYIGNKTDVLFTLLSEDKEFMAQDDETKAKKLQGYLTDINTAAKINVLNYKPKRVNKNVTAILEDIGAPDPQDAGIRSIDEAPIRSVDEE